VEALMERTMHRLRMSGADLRTGRGFVNVAKISDTDQLGLLRTAEELIDAANLLALDAALDGLEDVGNGPVCTDCLVQAAERAVRATGDIARLAGAAGLC